MSELLTTAKQVVAAWESGDLAGAVRKLSRAVDQTTANSPWIPVANGLPEPETDFFIKGVAANGLDQEYEIAGLFHNEWACRGTGDAPRFLVTHYMPIPA